MQINADICFNRLTKICCIISFMLRVLFIGDIVGRLGRKTIERVLPNLKKARRIDLCIGNGENLAGGRGLTRGTVSEVISYGVDLLTGGDHTFWREGFAEEISGLPVLRCANLEENRPGYGFKEIALTGVRKPVLVVSILGTESTFIREKAQNVFNFTEDFFKDKSLADFSAILVDFHAEASSEKKALGWFLDGKVSALLGTHTHVPTCDQTILNAGTAYVTDLGMVGSNRGVLGVKKEIIIERFRTNNLQPFEWVESGSSVFNSVLVEVDELSGRAVSIERIDRVLDS